MSTQMKRCEQDLKYHQLNLNPAIPNDPTSNKKNARQFYLQQPTDNQDVVMTTKKARKPPRKMEVDVEKPNIWTLMENTNSGISIAQLVSMNKEVAGDLQAGIRYLHGRKRKPKQDTKGKAKATNVVNIVPARQVCRVELDSDGDSDGGSYLDSDDGMSEFESEIDGSLSGYESDDTYFDYAYDPKKLKTSSPFVITCEIGSYPVNAIIDTGAATSVISSSLANKLGLRMNHDQVTIEQLDGRHSDPNGVCENVQVRIGGRLRPEHFVVQNRDEDLLILGMTWFDAYKAVPHPSERKLALPIKDGSKQMYVQGRNMESQEKNIYSVSKINTQKIHMDEIKLYEGDEVMDATNNRDEDVPEQIQTLIKEYDNKLFVENAGLGRIKGFEHRIVTTTEEPIVSKPYRMTWKEEEFLKGTLDELLEQGMIRPSNGKWAAPVIFVGKKNGELRVCQDYRKLNKITVRDHFPLPNIQELIDSLGGANFYSTLDAASGFWQLPMADDSIEKTGFTTKFGTFEFLTMSFGLTSAPASYQRTMSKILESYIGRFVYVFIDDIIIFSGSLSEHVDHLRLVFEKCMEYNLRLKKVKCKFCQSKVRYLGHTISKDGILPNDDNIKKVMEMAIPRCPKEIRSFLGMTGYYRRFLDGYADLAEPLTKLTRKNVEFVWGTDQQQAFDTFKMKLTSPPLLTFPDKNQVQILTTDGSGKGVSAILSQSPDGTKKNERVIAYASRILKPNERSLAITHVEALAIVWGVGHFRHYLEGRFFTLVTDCSALKYIFSNPKPSAKVSRWAVSLMGYDYQVQYRAGANNPADALSRLLECDDESVEVQVDTTDGNLE